MVKLKYREIAAHRALCLLNQNGMCLLCSQPLCSADAVLDHDHKSGLIRGALHRWCNTFLGKIENGAVRNRITPKQLTCILENYTTYVAQLTGVLHPGHRTPEEKILRARKLARASAARRRNKK